jgi:hypothetical protein
MREEAETSESWEDASISVPGQRSPGEQATIKRPGSDPHISGGGRILKWNLGTLRHHQLHDLPPLYVRFRDQDAIDDFALRYEIEESRTSIPVRGRLSVSVKLDLESPSSPTASA